MVVDRLAEQLESEFLRQLAAELRDYAFVMEGDVILRIPGGELHDELDRCWEALPDISCETHGGGKLVGSVSVHVYDAGEFSMVHRDLVDGQLRSAQLAEVAGRYPPFSR